MAPSHNKNLTIFILIILFILVIWGLVPFLMFNTYSFAPNPGYIGSKGFITFLPFVLLPIIWLAVAIWVFRDAEKRQMNGLAWGLLVFIGSIIGLLIYLIVRSDSFAGLNKEMKKLPCPNCQQSVESHFTFCPSCGSQLREICKKCAKEVEPGWRVCPHCGEKL